MSHGRYPSGGDPAASVAPAPHPGVDDIDARIGIARLVRGVQLGDDVGRVETGILRERARHDLESQAVLVDGVLVEPRLRLGVLRAGKVG